MGGLDGVVSLIAGPAYDPVANCSPVDEPTNVGAGGEAADRRQWVDRAMPSGEAYRTLIPASWCAHLSENERRMVVIWFSVEFNSSADNTLEHLSGALSLIMPVLLSN
jgi:hypothetical protein